jgi:hypothetical protein
MADLDVLPALYGVGTVEFKAGSEHALFNRLLAGSAWVRARTGHPVLERFTPLVRGISWLGGRFGDEAGAAYFEVTGRTGGRIARRAIGVASARDGGKMPAVLAGIAVEELLGGRLATPGIVPLDTWIAAEHLIERLTARGLSVWERDEGGPWRPWLRNR